MDRQNFPGFLFSTVLHLPVVKRDTKRLVMFVLQLEWSSTRQMCLAACSPWSCRQEGRAPDQSFTQTRSAKASCAWPNRGKLYSLHFTLSVALLLSC